MRDEQRVKIGYIGRRTVRQRPHRMWPIRPIIFSISAPRALIGTAMADVLSVRRKTIITLQTDQGRGCGF